jgi:hypothetical protein
MRRSRAAWPARRVSATMLAIGVGVLLVGCTGRGGGWLPPDGVVFAEKASFGFSFSCERSSNSDNLNPKPGRLKIQLSYTEHGSSPFGGPFSIHGVADTIDPVLESAICIGQEPPPGGNELIFLGAYRVTSSDTGPLGMLDAGLSCAETQQCRFEVIVQDNDRSNTPSAGDYFSIKLSGSTAVTSILQEPILYSRDGYLGGGNINVD